MPDCIAVGGARINPFNSQAVKGGGMSCRCEKCFHDRTDLWGLQRLRSVWLPTDRVALGEQRAPSFLPSLSFPDSSSPSRKAAVLPQPFQSFVAYGILS